jgi:hypothetical protein
MKTKLYAALGAISACALAVQSAMGGTITYNAGAVGNDGPLAATADFATSNGVLSVTITNDLSASVIRSAGQTVSDLVFTLSNAPGTLGTTSAAGQLANIGANGSVTNVAGTPTRWEGVGGGSFSISGNTLTLEAIGGGQPSQLLLPSGTSFTNANASITGGQFSPFVVGPETFTLNLSGITAGTTITAATFSFGTGPDTFIPGIPQGVPFSVPGPVAGAGLPGLIAAFGGLIALARRRRARIAC